MPANASATGAVRSAAPSRGPAHAAGLILACGGLLAWSVASLAQQAPTRAPNGRPAAQPVNQPGTQPSAQPGARPGANPGARPGDEGGRQPAANPPTNPQPAANPGNPNPPHNVQRPDMPQPTGDNVTLSQFAEAVELKTLVEYVAETLELNIVGSDALTGSVVINAPVTVPKSELLGLLAALLEQQKHAIFLDQSGFYRITANNEVAIGGFTGELATTRIIATPTLKPSSLTDAVGKLMGDPQLGGMVAKVAFIDDLGVIVITDTPRRVKALEDFIARILEQKRQQTFQRFKLDHISAITARQRAIELIGQVQPNYSQGGQPGQPGVPMPQGIPGVPGSGGGSLNNLAERLTVDPQGNALIFRGTEEESRELDSILQVIDQPSSLEVRSYFAGSAATEISKIAAGFGLGNVVQIDTAQASGPEGGNPMNPTNMQGPGPGLPTGTGALGGPTMVVDVGQGRILYYGTPTQHSVIERLITLFDTKQDNVVIEFYRLKNAKSEEVADLLNGMLNNQQTSVNNALLSGGGYVNRSSGRGRNRTEEQIYVNPRGGGGGENQAGAGNNSVNFAGGEDVFVLADVSNNQVLVKAPQKLQTDFKRLIDQLDLRKPQVYIEAIIVAVQATDTFRLAFETQLINAQGTGGVLNTNFGLGSLGGSATQPGNMISPKVVNTGLGGITAAIIKSDQVPIVMNALARHTDSRILSSPQILADNNEEAEIVAQDEQPTTTTTQTSGNPSQTSFGGYEQAGTKMKVTPQISEGNYVRLEYEIELSSFVGAGSDGVPPPKSTNNVTSKVSVPSDATVIVGGFKFDQSGKTVIKVPLLGDIPIVGQLFKDDNKSGANNRLYVFLTPRILRDPDFRDLILLTQGPQADAKLPPDEPSLSPRSIDIFDPGFTPISSPAPWPEPAPLSPGAAAMPIDLIDSQPSKPAPRQTQPTQPRPPANSPSGSDPTAWAPPGTNPPPSTVPAPTPPGQVKRKN